MEAAKQCGRGILPDVALPLANFGTVCRTFAQYDLVLFCYECGGAPLRDLLAGYPKQDKLEQIIKHGVELGAAHFIPFFSRYCVAAPKKEEQKNERYNRIAAEAAKQCGRGVLPDVALPLPNFGAVCRTFDQYDLVLFCYECGGAPLRQLLAETAPADGRKRKIAIVTGAKGGFAAEEAEMAAKAGARTVGLGPRILRCETAPLAVLASVMTLTGDLE